MGGTVRIPVAEGMRIQTPRGSEQILHVDLQRDQVTTSLGSVYDETDLRAPACPEPRSPEAVEAWLGSPELILVRSYNVECPCRCAQCSYLVVIRGTTKTASHQRTNGVCMCDDQCGCYPRAIESL